MGWPIETRKALLRRLDALRSQGMGFNEVLAQVVAESSIPHSTVKAWYMKHLRGEYAEEFQNAPYELDVDFSVEPVRQHSQSEDLPVVSSDPPAPARLVTDGGQLRCSRCSSSRHISEKEGSYFCAICGLLEFEGFVDEGPTSPYFPLGELEWMR